MVNPHLSETGLDYATGIHHCLYCEKPVADRHSSLEDHLLCVWTDHTLTSIPGILDTDDRGLTIPGQYRVPDRTVLTGTNYTTTHCPSHLPVLLTAAPFPEDCSHCGKAVDRAQDHTSLEYLWKHKTGHNSGFNRVTFHPECLTRNKT